MVQFQVELFGHVVYNSSLSYHEMLALEERFKATVQAVLEDVDAAFINFEPLGETLRFQCVFTSTGEDLYHAICDRLVVHVKGALGVRLLFVDKNMEDMYFYSLSKGRWQEGVITLPPAGHLA